MASIYGGYGTNQPDRTSWDVIRVWNRNDSGAGSLRQAVETNTPRVVVFEVGGFINLQTPLLIAYSDLYINGLTAPQPGIHLRTLTQPFNPYPRGLIATTGDSTPENVEICYLFMHKGDTDDQQNAAMNLNSVKNFYIHHNTMGFTHDNVMSVFRSTNEQREFTNFTLSWNIFHHSFANHATGLNITNGPTNEYEGVYNIDVHHNLFIHCGHRAPQVIGGADGRGIVVANNVTYGWQSRIDGTKYASYVDWRGNTAIASSESAFSVLWDCNDDTYGLPSLHVDDNAVFYNDGTKAGEDYETFVYPGDGKTYFIWGYSTEGNPDVGDYIAVPEGAKRATPLPAAANALEIQERSAAYTSVMAGAGAGSVFTWDYETALKADVTNRTSETGHVEDNLAAIATAQGWDTWYPLTSSNRAIAPSESNLVQHRGKAEMSQTTGSAVLNQSLASATTEVIIDGV